MIYLFYPSADDEQDRIWNDTREQWGEQQANAYIRELHHHIERLCYNPGLWRKLPERLTARLDINMPIYVSRCNRHYIFFRRLPSGNLGVMSILNIRMDIPARLAIDLAKAETDQAD